MSTFAVDISPIRQRKLNTCYGCSQSFNKIIELFEHSETCGKVISRQPKNDTKFDENFDSLDAEIAAKTQL